MTSAAERTSVTFRSSAFGVTIATPESGAPGRALLDWLALEFPGMGATSDHPSTATGDGWELEVHRGSTAFRVSVHVADDAADGPRWRVDVAPSSRLSPRSWGETGRRRLLSLALCVDAILRSHDGVDDLRWHARKDAAAGRFDAWARLPDVAPLGDGGERDTALEETLYPLLPGGPDEPTVRTRAELCTLLVRRVKALEKAGPLAFPPSIRTHVAMPRLGRTVDAYGALYPKETADSLIEFIAFIAHIATIEKELIRFGTSSLERFAPDTADVAARRLLARRDGGRVIVGSAPIRVKIEAQELPSRFNWVLEHEYRVARVRQNEADIALYAKSPDGWLSLFAIADRGDAPA